MGTTPVQPTPSGGCSGPPVRLMTFLEKVAAKQGIPVDEYVRKTAGGFIGMSDAARKKMLSDPRAKEYQDATKDVPVEDKNKVEKLFQKAKLYDKEVVSILIAFFTFQAMNASLKASFL